jgi:hypothetical protein
VHQLSLALTVAPMDEAASLADALHDALDPEPVP